MARKDEDDTFTDAFVVKPCVRSTRAMIPGVVVHHDLTSTGMDKSKCLSRNEEDELDLLRLHILIVCHVLGRYVKESLEYPSYWQRYTSSKMR